jgi:hypothetical protein
MNQNHIELKCIKINQNQLNSIKINQIYFVYFVIGRNEALRAAIPGPGTATRRA